jgi:hypothetical protein
MRTRFIVITLVASMLAPALAADENWPQFRGHGGLGIGDGDPPTKWNVETGENIAWKTPLPGLGHSSPIVWGDRIFLDVDPAVASGLRHRLG